MRKHFQSERENASYFNYCFKLSLKGDYKTIECELTETRLRLTEIKRLFVKRVLNYQH